MVDTPSRPLGLFIQPACLQHKYIRHANSSHIFERPERLRAVLLGIAAAVARLEEAEDDKVVGCSDSGTHSGTGFAAGGLHADDLSNLLLGLSINSFVSSRHLEIVSPSTAGTPGQVLLHHPALHLAHSPPPESPFPYLGDKSAAFGFPFAAVPGSLPSSPYLKDLFKWASEAVERIKTTGCEIPSGLGLNQGDLYLGPGSILAIEGAIQTVCQAIDRVCSEMTAVPAIPNGRAEPSTPPVPPQASSNPTPDNGYFDQSPTPAGFDKAFCAIRPPGHHCGENTPSGFCYVNNVVVGAMHAYLQHDVDRAIIIDFDLHHGNGTQALVMPLNAAAHAEDLAVKAGKSSPHLVGKRGRRRRGWKGFYGSVHDIDGDIDLIKDASLSLAAHGQYIENIHLQPYTSEADFYARIYPKYLTLLDKAKLFMIETGADAEHTVVLISAGFDACEHEHQGMQRHDRRVPTSFFSRYTRDIVAFADTQTGGKIVSVLEGGYSDRALTSAAMGHAIGLLDSAGVSEWWTETELTNIEKATKKKRTGKIAPFPPELSHMPYLVRTHALLAHFEGTGPEAPPSTANTPQHSNAQARMTLRDRAKAKAEDEGPMSTPAAARRGRRGGATPVSAVALTPRGKAPKAEVPEGVETPTARGNPANRAPEDLSMGGELQTSKVLSESDAKSSTTESTSRDGFVGSPRKRDAAKPDSSTTAAARSGVILIASSGSGVEFGTAIDALNGARPPDSGTAGPVGSQKAPDTTISTSQSAQPSKIILRFSRPSPTSTPPPEPSSSSSSIYPPVPDSTAAPEAERLGDRSAEKLEEDRLKYREGSAGTTSTEDEYVSAASAMSLSDGERAKREGTGETSGSEGLGQMPGRFR